MKEQYDKLIVSHDETINLLRSYWIDAKTPEAKKEHMVRLSAALDERLRLMNLRDESSLNLVPFKQPKWLWTN